MLLFHDPSCAEYGSPLRPEQPARIQHTVPRLTAAHPAWTWRLPPAATDEQLLLAHAPALLQRIQQPPDLDADTPYFPGIHEHARRAAGAALAAATAALAGPPAFALMRPPGHHCTRNQAMGFCYLNSIAVAALHAAAAGHRVAVWDFDAHHGNGTEDILEGRPATFFASVHQYPGYPGTGTRSSVNCRNFPVAPHTPRADHLATLARSWEAVLAFHPDLILVSAGFDAYVGDPLTELTLAAADFAELGRWLRASPHPVAAVLEGGYSPDLPELIDTFLTAWSA